MTRDIEDILASIRACPRDTAVVIEGNAPLAEALQREGFFVLSVGAECDVPSVPDAAALSEHWSTLTCRSSNAVCLGSKPLCSVVAELSTRAKINSNTAAYRSRGWAQHFLGNFHHLLQPSFGAYTGALAGVPAFIVGAGPGLDDDVELVALLAEKGLVIGVNAAARVTPSGMALTVEGNDLRFKLGELGDATIRAFSLFCPPPVLDHGTGPLLPIFTGELAGTPEHLTGYRRLACCSMGGTAAVSLAERLGCDPIVLVGHDFALMDGGRIYPECLGLGDTKAALRDGKTDKFWEYSWSRELVSQPRQNPLHDADLALPVTLADGTTGYTTHALQGPLRWLEQVATRLGGTKRLVQASARGAIVKGWQSACLADVVRELPDRQWELSPAENGLPSGVLLAWLERQMGAVQKVSDAAASRDSAALRAAMLRAPLVEPWCHARVAEASEAWRGEQRHQNPRRERDAAVAQRAAVCDAIAEEVPELFHELVMAASKMRALGGTALEDCRVSPGAAADVLRLCDAPVSRYDALSSWRKVQSWLPS